MEKIIICLEKLNTRVCNMTTTSGGLKYNGHVCMMKYFTDKYRSCIRRIPENHPLSLHIVFITCLQHCTLVPLQWSLWPILTLCWSYITININWYPLFNKLVSVSTTFQNVSMYGRIITLPWLYNVLHYYIVHCILYCIVLLVIPCLFT